MSEICASCGDEFDSIDGSEELCANCQEAGTESSDDDFGGGDDDSSDEY